jgi:DNA-3-methyladenine glycosylase II
MIHSDADLNDALDALILAVPAFAPVRAAAAPLPLRRIEPGFAGLAWIVTGQQISVTAASAIFARMQAALGGRIDAASLAAVDDSVLKQAGQSGAKIRSLRAIANAVLEGRLDLDSLPDLPAEEAIAALTALRGIGPWTAESYLLFALGHRDVFPAADIALQEAARRAFDLPARPSTKQLRALAEGWRPLRAVAARLLWAYYRVGRSLPADLSREP